MPNLKQHKFLAPERQFLAFPDHYVNIPGKIAFSELTNLKTDNLEAVYGDSRVVIPRGTVVHIDGDGAVTKPTYVKTTKEDGTKPNGVIFNTIYVDEYDSGTDDYINATVLVHGFVRKDRLYGDEDNLNNSMIHVVNK